MDHREDARPIYAIEVAADRRLLYAPFQNVTALLNTSALREIRLALGGDRQPPPAIRPLLAELRQPGRPAPVVRTGTMDDPLFLGLIPTRGCNLACRYCDFEAPKRTSAVMSPALARDAVEAYLQLLERAGRKQAEIHFFGGEPFFAPQVVELAVEYALLRTHALGMRVRFEATTNGIFPRRRAEWIADHFDAVVLSLDGPADIQERLRPAANGHPTFPVIARNARILSDGPVELIVRLCVTSETAGRMAETAAWLLEEFRPALVCFEPLKPSPLSDAAGLRPPDPREFAQNFQAAARLLAEEEVGAVFSTANLGEPRLSFCPVGRDAIIVAPDGSLKACYLLEQEWESRGLDLGFGRLDGRTFAFDESAVQRVRDLTAREKPACRGCLGRFHCAGGCHVHRPAFSLPGRYDENCLRTRLVTVARLLEQVGRGDLADHWLDGSPAAVAALEQPSDLLQEQEA